MDRLPPGAHCAESDDDEQTLAVFMEAIEEARSMDRHRVRDRAASEFDTDRIMDAVITYLHTSRLSGGRPGPNGKANATMGDKGRLSAEMWSR